MRIGALARTFLPLLCSIAASATVVKGQDSTSDPRRDWAYRNPATDSIAGIDLDGAYALLKGRPWRTTVVAVIDNGFDIAHQDLKNIIWTNTREIPGNGIDDDHNGYVDDVHGWNFRSAPDGGVAEKEQTEATRIYAQWKGRYEGIDSTRLTGNQRKQLRLYLAAKRQYSREVSVRADPTAAADTVDSRYALNLAFNSSEVIGDNPLDPRERLYGSPFMKLTPWLSHGTHVAASIGAERGNGVGIDGIADHVLIMPIVATTATGDERDKDVANAIRYAVDNGARIINLSFSKSLSQYKSVVDDAIRWAEKKDVLVVHAAGNDGEDNDLWPHYPVADYESGGRARNVITVGWSRSKFDERLAHPFSDYGAHTVDVFAPGSDIFSAVPGDKYEYKSGSSMSAPMVTGVAALLLSYFPRLTALQVKEIIMSSSFKPITAVNKPGTKQKVSFRSLSVSGGIVNAHNAVLAALRLERHQQIPN
jgi:subtilisin family serine protease